MRKFLKILAVVVVIIVLGIAAVFYFTAGLVRVADDFFVAAREGRMADAYALTSADFQATTSQERLGQFLRREGLLEYREASWSGRSVEGGRGTLHGTLTTDSGAIPISIGFVKGEDGWRIYTIEKPASGLQDGRSARAAPTVPEESEQVRLVRDATAAFAESVAAGSMAAFRDHVSELWKDQVTVEQLDQAFGAFIEADLDLSVLETLTPRFTAPPGIDERGVLTITGVYPTTPDELAFEQDYVLEGTEWKLIGFSVQFR